MKEEILILNSQTSEQNKKATAGTIASVPKVHCLKTVSSPNSDQVPLW